MEANAFCAVASVSRAFQYAVGELGLLTAIMILETCPEYQSGVSSRTTGLVCLSLGLSE